MAFLKDKAVQAHDNISFVQAFEMHVVARRLRSKSNYRGPLLSEWRGEKAQRLAELAQRVLLLHEHTNFNSMPIVLSSVSRQHNLLEKANALLQLAFVAFIAQDQLTDADTLLNVCCFQPLDLVS
tara:strand:+ start:2221 stop:2595 length:375 start_codon:yes stop_codon:yes gene_type:complete